MPEAEEKLEVLRRIAHERNLSGDASQRLSALARHSVRDDRRLGSADMVRFIRRTSPEAGGEYARHMLWESALLCAAAFADDPEALTREFCRGEIDCRAAEIIAEKQFLDTVVWKDAPMRRREREVGSELRQLFGETSADEIAAAALAQPAGPAGDPPAADPVRALKLASALLRIPDEIRRQRISDPDFPTDGVIGEVIRAARAEALAIDDANLHDALAAYLRTPDGANLLRWRRWHYRRQLDSARLPHPRGTERDRQFVEAMVLLQDQP